AADQELDLREAAELEPGRALGACATTQPAGRRPGPAPVPAPQAYIASIAAAYFSAIGRRLSFIVGVSSSPPGSQAAGPIVNFLICSTRASRSLAASIAACTASRARGSAANCSSATPSNPLRAAHSGAKSASRTTSAVL